MNGSYSALRLQRVVRRLRAVAQAGVHDRRGDRFAARASSPLRRLGGGADLPADRRRGAAALRRAAVDQRAAAAARGATPTRRREQPTSGSVRTPRDRDAGGSPTGAATVVSGPHGMSARDALRVLAQLGLTARLPAPASSSSSARPPGSADRVAASHGRRSWLDAGDRRRSSRAPAASHDGRRAAARARRAVPPD